MRALLSRFLGNDHDDDVSLVDDPTSRQYTAEPVRPWMLVGSRVLLWGAVAIGAAGGLVGCLSKTRTPEAPVVEYEPDPGLVPPQVTATAEHIVERWLMATTEQGEEMDELFVEPPELPTNLDGRYVVEVRTVASSLVGDRYWSVTVAVDMEQSGATEPVGDPEQQEQTEPTEGDEGDEGDGEGSSGPFTWHVEVGIVGDPSAGLEAHRTPAIMPPPSGVDDRRSSSSEPWRAADQDDDLVQTVDGFLDALLAGRGDPDRYFVEELDIDAVRPAPLDDVTVDQIATQELDDGVTRVQVQVTGTTPSGMAQPLAYELDVRWTGQEYEILRQWGSATLNG